MSSIGNKNRMLPMSVMNRNKDILIAFMMHLKINKNEKKGLYLCTKFGIGTDNYSWHSHSFDLVQCDKIFDIWQPAQ